MRQTKKNRPSVGAPRRPVENEISGQTPCISTSILPAEGKKHNHFVSDVLLSGRENAITGSELIKLLGLDRLRDLTMLIERERRQGSAICASVNAQQPGYYLASSSDELEAYIQSLNRRIKNIEITRLHLRQTLELWGTTNGA